MPGVLVYFKIILDFLATTNFLTSDSNLKFQVDQQHNHKFSYRPRILITGSPGQALSTYIGPALLHHLEKLPKHILDLPTLYSNSAR